MIFVQRSPHLCLSSLTHALVGFVHKDKTGLDTFLHFDLLPITLLGYLLSPSSITSNLRINEKNSRRCYVMHNYAVTFLA